jgi:hypothetical protein
MKKGDLAWQLQMSNYTTQAMELVLNERDRQNELHNPDTGVQSLVMPEIMKLGVLTEEYLEFVRTILDHESLERKAEECVQVAAVALAWIESMLKKEEENASSDY